MAILIGSGLQIAALNMYQDNINSKVSYIKRIYSSHAQVVCLALSLFLLHMHDVVITCNMRNAESSILPLDTTTATSWVCRTRQCTRMAIGALKSQFGSCLVRLKTAKEGGKKKKVSLRPSPSIAIILGVHRRP